MEMLFPRSFIRETVHLSALQCLMLSPCWSSSSSEASSGAWINIMSLTKGLHFMNDKRLLSILGVQLTVHRVRDISRLVLLHLLDKSLQLFLDLVCIVLY